MTDFARKGVWTKKIIIDEPNDVFVEKDLKEMFWMQGTTPRGGRGRKGGFGLEPSGVCVCTNPNCGYTALHQVGKPRYQMKCPKCGSPMVRGR